MRDGSREQTGCFLATLMTASAVFVIRALYRSLTPLASGESSAAISSGVVLFTGGLALFIVVCAVFALKLNRRALAGYGVALSVGIILSLRYNLHATVPLVIAGVAAAVIIYARRDIF